MQLGVLTQRTRRVFYGWWVVAAGFLTYLFYGATYQYGFSAFFLPLERETGWSRTAISGVISLSRLQGGFLGPLEGFLIDRFGPRMIMAVGVFLMGLGFMLLSFMHTLLSFYLVFVLIIALGGSLGMIAPASAALANWFIKKRSTVMGVVFCGIGLGAVGVPLLVALIGQFGWRPICFALGILLWLAVLPLAAVFRHRPEAYGYLPDGERPPVQDSPKQQTHVGRGIALSEEQDFTLRQAVQTPAFWLLSVAFGLRTMASQAMPVHLIPFLVGQGFSSEQAGTVLAAVGLVSVSGRLGFGWLGDRMDKRQTVAITNLMVAVGLILLVGTHNWATAILFVAVYAPGYGGAVPIMTAMRGDYFGRRYFATISGAMGIVTTLGTVGGPLFAGFVFDTTGSYRWAFLMYAAANMLASVLILVAQKPRLETAAPPQT